MPAPCKKLPKVGAPGANGGAGCVALLKLHGCEDEGDCEEGDSQPVTSESSGGPQVAPTKVCAADVTAIGAGNPNPEAGGDANGFGHALVYLGRVWGGGVFGPRSVAVGSPRASTGAGGNQSGALWILNLTSALAVRTAVSVETSSLGLLPGDLFGSSVSVLALSPGGQDLDHDPSTLDLAVGAPGDDEEATDAGAVYLLSLDPWTGLIRRSTKLHNFNGVPHVPSGGTTSLLGRPTPSGRAWPASATWTAMARSSSPRACRATDRAPATTAAAPS